MSGDSVPVGVAPRWGVSSLDWQSHAIDVDAEHPYGVYVARCGQQLVMGAGLYGEPPPGGWMCLACARWTERGDTGEVTEPPPAHPVTGPARWARSPLDCHAHWLLPDGEHPEDVLQARCGAVMTTSVTQHDQPPPGLKCQRCHLIFLADAAAGDESCPAGRWLSRAPVRAPGGRSVPHAPEGEDPRSRDEQRHPDADSRHLPSPYLPVGPRGLLHGGRSRHGR